jgi:hypothetical protein
MEEIMAAIKGKRTYLIAAAGAIVQGLVFAGILTQEQAAPILSFLGFGAAAALRAAVK